MPSPHDQPGLLPGAPGPGAPRPVRGEHALDLAAARTGAVPVPVGSLWDPWTCPAHLLPWLAWALRVDQWEPEWSTATKRSRIAAAIAAHRRKGTPWAVKRALEPYGSGEVIEETAANTYNGAYLHDETLTHEGGDYFPATYDGAAAYDGQLLHTGEGLPWAWAWFRVILDLDILGGEALAADAEDRLRALLDLAKPARSHLRQLGYRGNLAESPMRPAELWHTAHRFTLRTGAHERDGSLRRGRRGSATVRFNGGVNHDLTARYGALQVA
ncbi:MAG: phage tail protein I [Opitutales bacterium]|nr:phage tail protein I [Opitutales bacterium]